MPGAVAGRTPTRASAGPQQGGRGAGGRGRGRGGVRRRSAGHRALRVLIGLGLVAAVLAGAIGAVVVMIDRMRPQPEAAHLCYATLDGTQWSLEPDQAQNAALLAATARERGLPARAVTIAIATALQESTLVNIDYGDRDSVGLFQQRPSQGWGTVAQIMDPVYATGKFYDGLVKVDGYTELPVTVAAQSVQRSGFPDAYAQHETRARAWASALTGHSPEALTCELRDALPGGDVARLAARAARDLPSADVRVDPARRTVELAAGALPGADDANATALLRTSLAQWAVAVADEQQVESVTLDGRTWSRATGSWSDAGATATAPSTGTVVVTLAR